MDNNVFCRPSASQSGYISYPHFHLERAHCFISPSRFLPIPLTTKTLSLVNIKYIRFAWSDLDRLLHCTLPRLYNFPLTLCLARASSACHLQKEEKTTTRTTRKPHPGPTPPPSPRTSWTNTGNTVRPRRLDSLFSPLALFILSCPNCHSTEYRCMPRFARQTIHNCLLDFWPWLRSDHKLFMCI